MSKKLNILFLLGAGSSAPSGIETFRGKTKGDFNMDFFDINYVKKNKEESIKFFQGMRKDFGKAKENDYHKYIDKLKKSHNVSIISQNIDHLDIKYDNILKIHGDLNKQVCLNNHKHDIKEKNIGDRCPKCNSYVIPDIIYYNQTYKKEYIEQLKTLLKEKYDYFIIIGSTLEIGFIKTNVVNNVKANFNININPEFNIDELGFFNYKKLEDFQKDIILSI